MIRRKIVILVFSFVLAFSSCPANVLASRLPEVAGEAAIMVNAESGTTLFFQNAQAREYPASLTKLMTALLAYQSGIWFKQLVAIGAEVRDPSLENSTVFGFRPGDILTFGDLLTATLLGSYNDGAMTIARIVAGSVPDFVDQMNAKARSLGMKGTHFENPSGLPDAGQYTTAEDMAILARYIYSHFPITEITDLTSATVIVDGQQRVIKNINRLVGTDKRVNGLKTGYTSVAQNCLITSAHAKGVTLIAAILKSPGGKIYPDMQRLLDFGFAHLVRAGKFSAKKEPAELQ